MSRLGKRPVSGHGWIRFLLILGDVLSVLLWQGRWAHTRNAVDEERVRSDPARWTHITIDATIVPWQTLLHLASRRFSYSGRGEGSEQSTVSRARKLHAVLSSRLVQTVRHVPSPAFRLTMTDIL